VRAWAPRAGLEGRNLERFLVALGEMVEAVVLLSGELRVAGQLGVRLFPYSQWLTVELTFPRGIPLDPRFEQSDEALTELPALRLQPDIFWRRLILEWVDKATWLIRGNQVIVSFTQYARRPENPGELYFLGLTPKPTPGLELHVDPDGLALALVAGVRSAFRLGKESQFILEAADGKTSVREMYRLYVRRFGLTHPGTVGHLVEELITKGLLVPGEPLLENKRGEGLLVLFIGLIHLQASIPRPDALFSVLQRWLGWLWSGPGLVVVLGLVVWTIARLGIQISLGVAMGGGIANTSLPPITLLWLIAGLYLSIVIHELSHGMACKHFGRKVRAFGILLYYGLICAYVDTTETWMLQARWKRAMVSLAGPLSTLVMACLFHWGEYICLLRGWVEAGQAFNLLALISFTSSLLNLLPVLELDGYYALIDLLDRPNLSQKAFSYTRVVITAIFGRNHPPAIPLGDRLLYLGYALGSAGILAILIGYPFYNAIRLLFGGSLSLGAILSFLLALLLLIQALAQAGMDWYRRRYLTPLDLKAIR
jgi:putative peptide zinc metalloprotease protein